SIQHGLNDVGLSEESLRFMLSLLVRIAPFQPVWAAEQIARVIRERGFAAPKTGLDALPQSARTAISAVLVPVLRRWLAQASEREVIQVISAFATSGDMPEDVAGLLMDALHATSDRQIAEDILRLLRRHRLTQYAELVPALLDDDVSWLVCPAVARELLRYRQDLLTPFLRYQSYHGRFAIGQRRFLLSIDAPATGLTTRQQEIYATTLDAIIADPEQESAIRSRAIHRLALLPGISTARLQSLIDHPNTLIRTTALLAIGRADSGEGLPAVLAALQDSRGRIAILLLPRYLSAMPAEEALALLRTVPMSRVSVAKSVVRLIATIPAEAAFQELLALAGRELHRDVHTVVLEALWRHPTRPEIWPVMQAHLMPDTARDHA
ncbi:MAG TPA: hypothetical protein VKB76_18215, partial [Ktedonobacterales bacterium]|nr:hypothetical protein [Ktedonobacterales bacterium]